MSSFSIHCPSGGYLGFKQDSYIFRFKSILKIQSSFWLQKKAVIYFLGWVHIELCVVCPIQAHTYRGVKEVSHPQPKILLANQPNFLFFSVLVPS